VTQLLLLLLLLGGTAEPELLLLLLLLATRAEEALGGTHSWAQHDADRRDQGRDEDVYRSLYQSHANLPRLACRVPGARDPLVGVISEQEREEERVGLLLLLLLAAAAEEAAAGLLLLLLLAAAEEAAGLLLLLLLQRLRVPGSRHCHDQRDQCGTDHQQQVERSPGECHESPFGLLGRRHRKPPPKVTEYDGACPL